MPRPRLRVCPVVGCPTLTYQPRCEQHAQHTTQARGYGTEHTSQRRQWAGIVAAGDTRCARCHQPIDPLEAWHLDHTDDRSGYLGPSHAACDSAAGGRKS